MTSGIYKDKERNTFFCQKTYKGICIKKRGFKTKTECQNYLNQAIWDIDHPAIAKKDAIMLDDFFEKYILYAKTKVKVSTLDIFKRQYRNHISPAFGSTYLANLDPDSVELWKGKLVDAGFTELFTNKVISIFKAVLQYAVKENYAVDVRCIDKLEKVNLNQIPAERQIWTREQLDQFLDTFEQQDPKQDLYMHYFLLLFVSSMRPNEFRALQKKDIQGEYLCVNKTINSKLGEDQFLTTKNKNSVRKVLMPADAIDYMNRLTEDYAPDDFIFGKEKAMRETNLLRYLHKHSAMAGLHPIVLYGFRHSSATHMIRSGVNIKAVSKRLGHKDASTTMNVYWHLFAEDERQALSVLSWHDFGTIQTKTNESLQKQMKKEDS